VEQEVSQDEVLEKYRLTTNLMKNIRKNLWAIIITVTALVIATIALLACASSKLPLQPTSEDSRVTIAREQCELDLDDNGRCDSYDTFRLRRAIGTCEGENNYNVLADVDQDGCVTWNDQERLFPMFTLSSVSCDFDRDGDCDRKDYQFYLEATHMCFDISPMTSPYLAYNPRVDANRDGCVDPQDAELLFPIIPK
jgi:hypothetical protein